MKEFVEKLIEKLENHMKYCKTCHEEFPNAKMSLTYEVQINAYKNAIEIVKQLAEEYNNDGWIPCSKQLPPHSDDLLLIQCSGKPKNNIVFNNAFCLASYTKEGWLLELYPEWKGAEVIAWQPLPARYQPKGE